MINGYQVKFKDETLIPGHMGTKIYMPSSFFRKLAGGLLSVIKKIIHYEKYFL